MLHRSSLILATAGAVSSALAANVHINVDIATKYQQYDGTGISEAFQRSLVLYNLNNATRKAALDLLFTPDGAGMTILRNGLGSSPDEPFDLMKSIAAEPPSSNSSQLNFTPLPRDDQYQGWLSHEAVARGVHTIYADAWSADGYMKTNNTDNYGGYLCGVTNASCASGDWRQSYADKIVKYIQLYEEQGIEINYVGFLNEPDLNTTYASMLSSGQQAADFLEVLYPTLKRAGLKTAIACCDGSGWEQNRERITGIQAAGAEDTLGLVTSHGYSSRPGQPFATKHKVWQTEWSTFDPVNYEWYNSSGGRLTQSFGLTWANNIQSAFRVSNVTGFLYWWGAANTTDNQSLLIVNNTSELKATKRLWAMAHFGSKFIRQNAVRVEASVSAEGSRALNATAFMNTDGTVAVQIINNGNSTQNVSLTGLKHHHGRVATFLTNQEHDLHSGFARGGQNSSVEASIPAHSLFSFVASSGY